MLMSTQNINKISFCGEMWKSIPNLSPNTLLICSTGHLSPVIPFVMNITQYFMQLSISDLFYKLIFEDSFCIQGDRWGY